MIKNFFKIGIRNLIKQKIYSIINIFGLSVGIASCALIMLHVEDEFSYDQFHEKKDRLYHVTLERIYPNHSTYYALIPHSFSEVMVSDFPEVVNATRIGFFGGGSFMVRYKPEEGDEIAFEETLFLSADSNFFEIFTLKLVQGDPATALEKANNIVITEEIAKKYFGDADPMNKVLTTDFGEFTVTGVSQNIPENSHFEFNFLSSISTFPFFDNPNFIGFSAYTYLELAKGANPRELEKKFLKMVEQYASPQIQQNLNLTYKEYTDAGNGYRYYLRPITSIHLDPTNIENKLKAGGSKTYVFIFISVSVLILLIACINFMNLATARSAERAKEVGIRKTLGSLKQQLINQFLIESILISFISMLLALGIMFLALPYFNNLAEKSLTINLTGSLIIPGMIAFALLVGLLAGSYPAFVISGYNPVDVMKGKLYSSSKSSWLRNGLVVFQFAISIILIVGMLIVQKQIDFMQNKALGFDKEHLIYVTRTGTLNESFETFKNEVKTIPGVVNAAGGNAVPGMLFFGSQFVPQGGTEALTVKSAILGDDYTETLGLEIMEGRDFSERFDDSLSVILNESAIATIGVKDPIGMKLENTVGNPPVTRSYTVVGVVRDFHFQSLRDEITPLVLFSSETIGRNNASPLLAVRIKGANLHGTIASVEKLWKEMAPQEPFKFEFLDDFLDAQYKTEKTSGKIFGIFAGLAIIIACVGLFGLAAYTAGLRTKEIGVRKVMGASVTQVVIMLSMDFTKLILIAFVIAVPVSWYGMNNWLDNFYYRIDIGIGTFVLAGMVALVISWLTVSYQSIKAAIVNPVNSLRSE